MKKIINVLVMFALVFTLRAADTAKAKYIFLMIGDGMGVAHRSAAEIYKNDIAGSYDLKNSKMDNPLVMNTFPVQSLCTTHSLSSLVTGSASAGTAFATGYKVKSGVVSLNMSDKQPYKTIAEIAKENNMKVGIITSVNIDHATPAVFYAHQESRNSYYDISMQLAKSNFDFFGGGGAAGEGQSKSKGEKSPVDFAKEHGYTVTTNREELLELKPDSGKVWAYTDDAMVPVLDRTSTNSTTLVDFVKKAIELLENPNGFFIMVEGGQIDWASHKNDAAATIHEVLEFDETVGLAYEFYTKHPEETLIIVVADHETGGLALGNNRIPYRLDLKLLKNQKMTQQKFGEQVDDFKKDKTSFEDAMPVIQEIFGFRSLNKSEMDTLQKAYENSMSDDKKSDEQKIEYGRYNPLAITCCKILAAQAGLSWGTFNHTGIPVQISALGVGQDAFIGGCDLTDIFQKLNQLIK